ncbi:MAG: glycerophosphodiester phosphodiesterase [Peptococcaceae bacterium]|nr:glycerophosphodiester phosphodiesterase [Peptococcaceae bacterium]
MRSDNGKKPLLVAHRGGSGLCPENTLEAFRTAFYQYRSDMLELDVWESRDGHLVVIHDETVDRTTNGTGKVRKLTLEQLKRLDAGYWFTPDEGKTYPWRGMGVTVPTLKEVFEQLPGAFFNIEIHQCRPPMEEKLYRLITGYGLEKRVLVGSVYHRVARRLRSINEAGMALFASACQVALFYVFGRLPFGPLYRPRVFAFEIPERYGPFYIATPRLVHSAKKAGYLVLVWIVNDMEDMKRLLNLGVDGIITDYPDRFRELVK